MDMLNILQADFFDGLKICAGIFLIPYKHQV